jgi:hypothetical protein
VLGLGDTIDMYGGTGIFMFLPGTVGAGIVFFTEAAKEFR